ncbi:DUF3825 domain-containing protein [Hespellia stercorisuis]|uniref:DUF3825 domain-containing protein n=1 Tax=Hespellia stercorisuis DSM 15480 TaxID=1121950 RepID=A0A1M6SEL3_9FIRM|nr:DUF3825 domain-containing protein [Hespellia stercorisuis]SHK43224.1 protein of unknown function [Hespellia stercorisuis DSM 15480]
MITEDLFDFAYIPDWYEQLEILKKTALPEAWSFKKPQYTYKNEKTPILERYIQHVFHRQTSKYNLAKEKRQAEKYLFINTELACFHTGLYNQRYKAIYGVFSQNRKPESTFRWFFQGFVDEMSPYMMQVEPLPLKPTYDMAQYGAQYNQGWKIRVNVEHILSDKENLERIPPKIRKVKNLPLLLEMGVEYARRKASVDYTIVVPQLYRDRVQFLLPICLTNMEKADLAMAISTMDGYYLGHTCLTLEMAYLNARMLGKPAAPWLTSLVK